MRPFRHKRQRNRRIRLSVIVTASTRMAIRFPPGQLHALGRSVSSTRLSLLGLPFRPMEKPSLPLREVQCVLWNAADGRLLKANDRLVAIGTQQGPPSFGLLLVPLPCEPSRLFCAPVFAPDGGTIAIPCQRNALIWTPGGDPDIRSVGKTDREMGDCVFSLDGALLAWASTARTRSEPSQAIEVWEPATGKLAGDRCPFARGQTMPLAHQQPRCRGVG